MDPIRARLEDARRTGEILRIAYHGGSQPGTSREISPISIDGDDLIARDLINGEAKTFKVSRIELLDDNARVEPYNPTKPPATDDGRPLGEVFGDARQELEDIGWHVEIGLNSVTVHRYFKNGKPRKTADVGIHYSEWTVDLVDDFDGRGLQELRRPSQRPFYVHSRRFDQARAFAVKTNAVALFWEEARRLSPKTAT